MWGQIVYKVVTGWTSSVNVGFEGRSETGIVYEPCRNIQFNMTVVNFGREWHPFYQPVGIKKS